MTKKTTMIIAGLAVIALSLAGPAFPGTIPSSIVPEGARWIAHLDMEKFVATQFYGHLDKSGTFEMKSRDIERWLKIDVPKDVKSLTVFGLGPDDEQIVIAISGKFDKAGLIAQVEKEADHTKTAYGAYTIYTMDGNDHGAFINDSLIVFSEGRGAIEKVLDTAGGKAKNFSGTPLSASLKGVPSTAFLSGVMPELSRLSDLNSQSKVLEKASGLFFLAQEKTDQLLLRLQVTADSPESAKNMVDVVNGLIAMGRLGGNDEDMAKLASLLDGLQVKLEGKVVTLDFERPSKEIADLISEKRGFHLD